MNLGGGALSVNGNIGSSSSIGDVSILQFSSAQLESIEASNLTMNGFSGAVAFNGSLIILNDITANVGPILFGDTIIANNLSVTAYGAIMNLAAPVSLTIAGNAYLNAIGEEIGTPGSPIQIDGALLITIGATGNAYLTGTPVRACVDYDFSNPPTSTFFGGIEIDSCNTPPPPSPSDKEILPRYFYVPGIYSTDNNFGTFAYNIPYFYTLENLNLSAMMPPLYIEFRKRVDPKFIRWGK